MDASFSQVAIDLFFLILCLRVIYISISRGILREGFKVLSFFLGSFFAFHYYTSLSGIISANAPFLNREYFLFISFLLIFLGITLIFAILRLIVTFFFKKGDKRLSERVLLFVIGAFRASLLASVIIFSLHLSPLDSKYFCHSMACNLFKNVGPRIYLTTFKVYNKFNPEIILNKEVKEYYEVKKFLSRSSKERD